MGISLGGGKLNRAMLGDQKIKAIMLGAQKIWSGMGKKWIYVVHGQRFNNGFVDIIDADTMALISTYSAGDLWPKGKNLIVDNDYDHHGNMYFVTENSTSSGWVPTLRRMNRNATPDYNAGNIGNFTSIDLKTMDMMYAYTRVESGRGYPYIDVYGTNDGGSSYYLKLSAPQKVTAGGSIIREGNVIGPVVHTKNYIYYFTASSEDSESYCGSRYRSISRYDLRTLTFTALVTSNGSKRRDIEYVPLCAHPTALDHYYSINLRDDNYFYISNWLQLRNQDGAQIAAIALPGVPVNIRPFEGKLLVVVNDQILEVQLNLSSYRVLCGMNPDFMDLEYFVYWSSAYDGNKNLTGWNVGKYNYSGVKIGSTFLDMRTYYTSQSNRYCAPGRIVSTHPELEP